MHKRQLKAIRNLLISILLIINIFQTFALIRGEKTGLELTTIGWQDPPEPGVSNADLSIGFLNLHNRTIKGIVGNLSVLFPFSDPLDTDGIVLATGVATSSFYFNVSQYSVLSGDPFQIIFPLDIDINASKGTYQSNLIVSYFLRNLTLRKQEFSIDIVIPNSPPEIELYRPSQGVLLAEPNKSINFEVIGFDPDSDDLSFEWLLDNQIVGFDSKYLFRTGSTLPMTHRVIAKISDGIDTTTQEWQIIVDQLSTIEYSVNTQYLEVGSSNNVSITLSNNIWNGSVDCSFTVPQPLIIRGNASKTYENITANELIVFSVLVYAPNSVIGQTSIGSLILSFTDEYSTPVTETINIGLIAKGRIVISLFDAALSNEIVEKGGSVTVSGTILNSGNYPALFANASLRGSSLVLLSKSRTYIGEIEPDSPLPFSLTSEINSTVAKGDSIIECIIFYQDDLYEEHFIVLTFKIQIKDPQTTQSVNNGESIVNSLLSSGFTFILILGTVTGISLILYRFYRKSK